MKATFTRCVMSLALILFIPAIATAKLTSTCNDSLLKGSYVFTASGFTRPPSSVPGTLWTPKAILEVIEFDGDGALSTPKVTVANPFGDTGLIMQPPNGGAPGEYVVNDDCTGTVHFFDANNVTFSILVIPPRGEQIQMIQTNPSNNVFQGTATRIW